MMKSLLAATALVSLGLSALKLCNFQCPMKAQANQHAAYTDVSHRVKSALHLYQPDSDHKGAADVDWAQ